MRSALRAPRTTLEDRVILYKVMQLPERITVHPVGIKSTCQHVSTIIKKILHLIQALNQRSEARNKITIDEERINRSYGASPSATSRHVNCAPYFKLRLSSNKILLILVSKFQTPQHSFFRLGLLPSALRHCTN